MNERNFKTVVEIRRGDVLLAINYADLPEPLTVCHVVVGGAFVQLCVSPKDRPSELLLREVDTFTVFRVDTVAHKF